MRVVDSLLLGNEADGVTVFRVLPRRRQPSTRFCPFFILNSAFATKWSLVVKS